MAGAYAHKIFVQELGAKEESLAECTPKVILTEGESYDYSHIKTNKRHSLAVGDPMNHLGARQSIV